MLVSAYGNDYSVQVPYQFTINGSNFYPLPSDFYKLLGVDLQSSASSTGWVTLKRFEFIERNRYSFASPLPLSNSTAQLWYVPEPTPLQFIPTCATTASSTTVTVNDVADITVGMSVYSDVNFSIIPDNTTVISINAGANQVTLSNSALLTKPIIPLFFWTDAATVDGISGWEEFIVIDAAIKAGIKQETDLQYAIAQRQDMIQHIESMAEGRDIGQAHHVSDALATGGNCFTTAGGNLRYRITGSQIQFACAGSENDAGTDGGWGGF